MRELVDVFGLVVEAVETFSGIEAGCFMMTLDFDKGVLRMIDGSGFAIFAWGKASWLRLGSVGDIFVSLGNVLDSFMPWKYSWRYLISVFISLNILIPLPLL